MVWCNYLWRLFSCQCSPFTLNIFFWPEIDQSTAVRYWLFFVSFLDLLLQRWPVNQPQKYGIVNKLTNLIICICICLDTSQHSIRSQTLQTCFELITIFKTGNFILWQFLMYYMNKMIIYCKHILFVQFWCCKGVFIMGISLHENKKFGDLKKEAQKVSAWTGGLPIRGRGGGEEKWMARGSYSVGNSGITHDDLIQGRVYYLCACFVTWRIFFCFKLDNVVNKNNSITERV